MLLAAIGMVAVAAGTILGQSAPRPPPALEVTEPGLIASAGEVLDDPPPLDGPDDRTEKIAAMLGREAPAGAAEGMPPTFYTRIPKPVLPDGPRRVGIQAGHWRTEEAPPDLPRLLAQTGTSWEGVNEIDVNLDVAQRVAALLAARGIAVDVLPATIPPGYLADAFVALHADGDGTGETSGFKLANSSRRTPYEVDLLEAIKDDYAAATGMRYDGEHVTRGMRGYYAMAWHRVRWSTAPFTPSVILEMGYLSNDGDRELMTERADLVAGAIASGIIRFLDAHPRETLFGADLLVAPPARFDRTAP